MKKIVRLTESELIKVIKQVLNETTLSTYKNAFHTFLAVIACYSQVFHVKIGWVVVKWHLIPIRIEELVRIAQIAKKCQTAFSQKAKFVEHFEYFARWLMNRAHNDFALPR